MPDHKPATQRMKISDVKNTLSSLINAVYRKEIRILVEKSGIPVAAIVSADDLERLSRLERAQDDSFKVIDELREAFKDVPPEEIERETDRIISRIRAEEQELAPEAVASR